MRHWFFGLPIGSILLWMACVAILILPIVWRARAKQLTMKLAHTIEGFACHIPKKFLLILTCCGIAIVPVLLWVLHGIKTITKTEVGLGTYGKAILVILAVCLFLWLMRMGARRIWRARSSASSLETANTPRRSGWRTFGILYLSFAGITFILLLFGPWAMRKWIPSSNRQTTTIPPVHEDTVCRDGNRHRKELIYTSFSQTDIYETFPGGCGVFIKMPRAWGYSWQIEPADEANAHRHIYVKEPGVRYRGAYDISSDANMHLMSTEIYIQAAEPEVKIHFWTDLRLPAAPVAALTTTSPGRRVYESNEPGVVPPKALTSVQPELTDEARRANFTGTVPVSVIVNESGDIDTIDILKSPGLGLDDNITKALRQWKFQPGTKDGFPVPVRLEIDVILSSPVASIGHRGFFFINFGATKKTSCEAFL